MSHLMCFIGYRPSLNEHNCKKKRQHIYHFESERRGGNASKNELRL